MAVRLVVTITAAPGKGAEFARTFKPRCEESRKDPGCQQFEIYQSVFDPDKFTLIELWDSQASLDAHAKLQAARPPLPAGLPPAPASARITNTTARDSGYSITSSASESRVGDRVRPSAAAAFWLTTNSNLAGCCTGQLGRVRPLEDADRRIRPTA